jgi:hypothetical protein
LIQKVIQAKAIDDLVLNHHRLSHTAFTLAQKEVKDHVILFNGSFTLSIACMVMFTKLFTAIFSSLRV